MEATVLQLLQLLALSIINFGYIWVIYIPIVGEVQVAYFLQLIHPPSCRMNGERCVPSSSPVFLAWLPGSWIASPPVSRPATETLMLNARPNVVVGP